jgi:hypothetical protein
MRSQNVDEHMNFHHLVYRARGYMECSENRCRVVSGSSGY